MKLSRRCIAAFLYAGLLAGANPLAASAQDYSAAEALRDGDMRKLLIASEPAPVSDVTFSTPDGATLTLADFTGKVTVVNFWATWCTPCRTEMPSLDALQRTLGGETFEVIAIASGPKNEPEKIARFFEDEEITALGVYLDPKGALARDMQVLGLPITVVLDPQGQEIARLRGDADWSSENAIAVLSALIDAGQS